jgi:mono/diheme cytochrome c family protein
LPEADRVTPLATILTKYGDDPITVDAAISGLRGQESAVLTKLLAEPSATHVDAVSMLAGAATKSRDKEAIEQIMAAAADASRPQPLRLALLRGLDAGIAGAARPSGGIVAASGPAAAAGAGAPGVAGFGGGRGRGTQNNSNVFTEEPTPLTTLASESGEIGDLAKQIVARISWPGKPAPAGPAVPPLTAAEQKRYAAGAEIYANICVACHQPDGRGKDKLAPPLVGSKFALAPPAVPARILLGGKEGSVGLMPPLASLSDDQIASVLTYIRREWGNSATAVDAPAIKEIRGLTASHTRPWTEPELIRLMSGRGGGGG